MYREQDQDLKTQLPVVLENLHDNRQLRTGSERSEEGTQQKAKRPGRRARLHGAPGNGPSSRPPLRFNDRRAALPASWWMDGRYMVSTDDAYVRAHNTTLASKISGYVASIPIEDNARINAGDVIATIDDGDYRLAADAAREKVATQQATVDRIGRQIVAQGANIDQAKAQMLSAQAEAKKTQLEFERQQALAVQKFASQQTLEQAEANRDQAAAAVQSAQAVIDAAQANLDVLKAQQQRSGAHARRTQDRAGESRTRPVVHRHPRAGRRRIQQSRGADRRLRADRPAHREPGAARATSISKPISRRRSLRGSSPASRFRSASMRLPDARHQRHGGEPVAGIRRGVLALAAR